MFDDVINFIQKVHNSLEYIPLHQPRFIGNEKKYLNDCIDSSFVSSLGKFVNRFEEEIANFTGANYAVATINGTSALHISLLIADITKDDEVITQPLSFVATCNAISYCGAQPIFVDVESESMGMSPLALEQFLEANTTIKRNQCINNLTGKVIKACIPMHTFGNPCRVNKIKEICDKYHIVLIEDAAESLGSFLKNQHTGTFGEMGILSFNGNKIITAGGGGCIITDNELLAKKAKHLTTTAKVSHKWEFHHDIVGYNYRMPNLNAALLVAQLEKLDDFLESKRKLAEKYNNFFRGTPYKFVTQNADCKPNYWLNSVIFKDKIERDNFLYETNSKGVMTRPIWTLMNRLPMFKNAQCGNLKNAQWLEERVVNLPSSVLL